MSPATLGDFYQMRGELSFFACCPLCSYVTAFGKSVKDSALLIVSFSPLLIQMSLVPLWTKKQKNRP